MKKLLLTISISICMVLVANAQAPIATLTGEVSNVFYQKNLPIALKDFNENIRNIKTSINADLYLSTPDAIYKCSPTVYFGGFNPLADSFIVIVSRGVADANGQGVVNGIIEPAAIKITNGSNIESFVVDTAGNVYVADFIGFRILKITPSGIISNYAGTGVEGYSGDGGPANTANIGSIDKLVIDKTGNIYFLNINPTDNSNGIRKINTNGVITTVKSNSNTNFTDYATIDAIDKNGNIYFALDGQIKKLDVAGNVTRIAGANTNTIPYPDYGGDGGLAINAVFADGGLNVTSVDDDGNIYINENYSGAIRKIDAGGIITRIAGDPYIHTDFTGRVVAAPNTNSCSTLAGFNINCTILEDVGSATIFTKASYNKLLFISGYYDRKVRYIDLPNGCVVTSSTTNVSICPSQLPYSWNGIRTSAGTYTLTTTNSQGCDSTATLNLTVKTNTTSTTNASICPSALPYSWNGSRSAAGTYTFTTTNSQGCDSMATLNLTVKSTSTSTTNLSICPSGLPYSWNGSRTTAGTYTFTTTNSQGCDSVATLNLTVKTNTTSTTNVSICPSALPYSWNGNRSAAGTYTYTTTNSQGCDSVATLNLTVTTNTTSSTNLSICPSSLPYYWNGLTFNTSGSQTAHLTNATGCDSAATLNLTIGNSTSSTTNITKCGSYLWNAVTYTTSGVYNKLFTSNSGCDSTAILNLTILTTLPAISGASSVCVGSSIALSNTQAGGVWSSIAGRASVNAIGVVTGQSVGSLATIKYTYTSNSCNLSTTKNIAVNAVPATPSIGYKAPFSNPQAGAPTGGFCVGKVFGVLGTPTGGVWTTTGCITTTTAGIATINTTGAGSLTYTYINANGCVNTRTMIGAGYTCAARGVVASNEKLETRNEFSLFPNPAKSIVNLNQEILIGTGSVVINDLYGKTVKTQPLSMGNNTINITNLSKGFYLVSTITSNGKTTKKLIVE